MRAPCVPSLLACALLASCAPPDEGGVPLAFVAVTFNTGTSEGMPHDDTPEDGYGGAQAALSDQWYGDGLAWQAVVDDATLFLAEVKPDVIGFQEIFYSGDCEAIPDDARAGFVCETWRAGDETVAATILGEGYQVACHLEKSDKCLAVKRSFGELRGCESDLCLDGLDGARLQGCGSGSRVGRGTIDLVAGGELTVVNVHGSSGITADDEACRARQFEQVWEDLLDGSGEPAANGERNLVLGDFNTDPGRLYGGDESADEILAHTGRDKPFEFISDVGESAAPTYAGLFNIDHVISDFADGACWAAGGTDGHPDVSGVVYFDHKPIVCDVRERTVAEGPE